eukprot:EG_transcript_10819
MKHDLFATPFARPTKPDLINPGRVPPHVERCSPRLPIRDRAMFSESAIRTGAQRPTASMGQYREGTKVTKKHPFTWFLCQLPNQQRTEVKEFAGRFQSTW